VVLMPQVYRDRTPTGEWPLPGDRSGAVPDADRLVRFGWNDHVHQTRRDP